MKIISTNAYRTKRKEGKTFVKEDSSVLMLSGGVDSVAVLKRLLEETDKKIYAHHIHMKNNEGINNIERYKVEAKALKKIVPHMKRTFRNFHYTESTIDSRQIMQVFPTYYNNEEESKFRYIPDQTYYYLMAGILAKGTDSANVYIGTCIEDYCIEDYVYTDRELQQRQQGMSKIVEGAAYPFITNIQRPFDTVTKKKSIEYLGKELMDMVWYCRDPIEKNGSLLSCNTNLGIYKRGIDLETGEIFKCRSCRVVSDALIEIEEEETQRGIKYA